MNFPIRIVRLLLLLALQVLVLNNIHLWNYATAMPIGYMLMRFDRSTSRISLLLWGFVTGIIFDMFSDTPGMNSTALTLLAMLQPSLVRLFAPRDSDETFCPSMRTMGFWRFTSYAFLSMLISNGVFYLLDAFTLDNWQLTLFAIGGSTLLSTIFCLTFENVKR